MTVITVPSIKVNYHYYFGPSTGKEKKKKKEERKKDVLQIKESCRGL